MKKNGSSWLTILLTLAVGILLIAMHSRLEVLQWIIIAMGVCIGIPSAVSLFSAFSAKKKTDNGGTVQASSVIAGLAGLALALWMVINPTFFVGLLAYLFAALLIVYGIFHIVLLAYGMRPYAMPVYFYIVPALMIIAGVIILCTSVHTMNSVVVLIMGIMLSISAINWALEMSVTNPAQKRIENQ